MAKFQMHALLAPAETPNDTAQAFALLEKRLRDEAFPFCNMEHQYLDVVVGPDERRASDLRRVIQRIYDKTGVEWGMPYNPTMHDEAGVHKILRWSEHPWGIRVEGEDAEIEFAQTLDGARVRTYPGIPDHVNVDLPPRHLETMREHAGVNVDPSELDWESLLDLGDADPATWGSAFAVFADNPADIEDPDPATLQKYLDSHQRLLEMLAQARIPYIELNPGYVEFKVKGDERKDQLVISGLLASLERQTHIAWENPAEIQWLGYTGENGEVEASVHQMFVRIENPEAQEVAKAFPGAEVHAWPNGDVAGVDFWFADGHEKAAMEKLIEWAGPPVD
jgi:hypothetical protein